MRRGAVASIHGRLPRNVLPAEGVYHLTTRGVAGRLIYRDDDDQRTFLALLAGVVGRYDWRCHAFCLMPNHYHLVVEAFLAQVSGGMHWLNGVYGQHFNVRYRRLCEEASEWPWNGYRAA